MIHRYDPDGWAEAAGVAGATPPPIFGSASSFDTQLLPARKMTNGPLAPVTATAANAAAHIRSTDDINNINNDDAKAATKKPATKKRAPGMELSEELDLAPKAKKAAKPKAPARTEPVCGHTAASSDYLCPMATVSWQAPLCRRSD
jgi:hypothetical protein